MVRQSAWWAQLLQLRATWMSEAVAGQAKTRPSHGPDGDWEALEVEPPGPGSVVEAVLGTDDLVVWRTALGEACVMEARCPHQWSHLAQEGWVDGAELVCLAHFWRFTTSGEGWKANLGGRRDRKGDIDVRPCREVDGRIWVRRTT